MEKIRKTCALMQFSCTNMLVYACFPVFSPFSAHFYPPLHHNGKGSIVGDSILRLPRPKSSLKWGESMVSFLM